MLRHFATKGVYPNSPVLKQQKADLFEIYCSQDSQLTNRARQQGLWAERHGLKDGDLSTADGRAKLYDRLLQLLPRDIWLAPKCRAWCRWNEFNRHRSVHLAQKIIRDRENDQVHLLLCDAVFEFQSARSPDTHAHLEQPAGSQMLFQEELDAIIEQSFVGRCDMCTAGALKHPNTHMPLQKGTQIVTTSRIMQHQIEALKCNKRHQHSQIAGSCYVHGHGRMFLSQYSELYTRVFADKVIRSLQCSASVTERNSSALEDAEAFVTRPAESSSADESLPKRQRLGVKQTPSQAYLQQLAIEQQLNNCLQMAMKESPKVGKRVFWSGILVEEVQKLCQDMKVQCVETCKGADRRRAPPPELKSAHAPWRKTFGIHRHTGRVFCDAFWEEWGKTSRRNLIRKCQPSRILVTVFASTAGEGMPVAPNSSSTERPDFCEPDAKRMRYEDTSQQEPAHKPQESDVPEMPSPEPSHKHSRHGPKFLQLSPEQRQQLVRMHNNLGHPDATVLGNVLRDQNWPSEAIEGIRDLHCPACFERQQPKLARPSHLSESRQFNDTVAIDAVTWTSQSGLTFTFYHMIDMATNYHVAFPCEHRPNCEDMARFVTRHWIQWAGPPNTLVHDSAGEFCGEEFGRFLQSFDIRCRVIPAESHWQLSRCERHGGIIQSMLDKWQLQYPITSYDDFEVGLTYCTSAKNSLSRHRGYSPEILVLGKSRHVPACNSNKDTSASDYVFEIPEDQTHQSESAEVQQFLKNLSMREQARIAFIRADHDVKLRRALLRRSRPERESFSMGQWVMYWRNGKGSQPGSWNGPARVVLREDRHVTWITHQSRLYRCAPEHLRSLSDREAQMPEVLQDHGPLKFPVSLGSGVFQYHDLTSQSPVTEAASNSEAPAPAPVESPMPTGMNDAGQTAEATATQPILNPVQTLQDQTWTHEDEWRGNMLAHMSMPTLWTGQTVLTIKPEHVSACPTQQQYIHFCSEQPQRGYEISLVLDAHEILTCSRQEPCEQVAFRASNAKRQKTEVKERTLTPQDKALFNAAKTKEIVSWLSTETVRKIARSQIPEDQILRSRWVLTWKPLDKPMEQTDPTAGDTQQVTHKPKARLVILGFEDPQLETLARDSPTMGRDSRSLIFQYAASARWRIKSFDIQTAFLRGRRQDGRILGMDPPEEMRTHMQLKPWECCELLKSAYGLCNAPLLWYEELKGALIGLGFRMSPLDPCVFALPRADGQGIHGIVGIHVDDGLGAGDEYYTKAIGELESRYPFGSKLDTDFNFTGIHVHQNWDGSIELDQCKYIEDIPPIEVPRYRRQNVDLLVNEAERQSLRALVGSIQYAATNTRPDLSAKLSLLQAKITTATVKDLLEGNRLLHEAKSHKHTKITFKSIPLHDLRFVSFSNASFANRANAQSQKGCLILAASKCIGESQASDVSPLLWYSKKIARVVSSTLASEAYALSGAVDLLSWIRIHWSWICCPNNEWKNPEQSLAKGPEAYAVVDCKSLYDLIQKTTIPQCSEHRTMLEALVIKDRIKEGIVMKWVRSAAQLADSLTKHMDCSVLREFLQKGKCIIHDVAEVLRERADKRTKKMWMSQFQENQHQSGNDTTVS
eukprot:s385_g4.t1